MFSQLRYKIEKNFKRSFEEGDITELENGIEKAEKLKRLLDEIKISIKEVKDLL